MSQTPQDPDPELTSLPETDIGDDREAVPGVGPTSAGEVGGASTGDDTGGPDTQLAPDKE